ncbi:MAG: hypothetical protein ACP5I8_15260, partial [Phycisphaerae bacterium]
CGMGLTQISLSNNKEISSAVRMAQILQEQNQHDQAIRDLEAQMNHQRKDTERILIVVSAIARAQGITVPERKDVP